MWMPTALASSAEPLGGMVWRVVEHQYTTATRRIVVSLADQDLLEDILEANKPLYPDGTEHLHYLLKTPFRYRPVHPHGSRFRKPEDRNGVFYASEQLRTAFAEMAYYRIRFFADSPRAKLPHNEERLTAFTVTYQTLRGIDLTRQPLRKDHARWTHPVDYSATQALAEAARTAGITSIRYESVRDSEGGINIALLTAAVFMLDAPMAMQTWLLFMSSKEIGFRCDAIPGEAWSFPRNQFADPSRTS